MLAVLDYSLANIQKEKTKVKFLTSSQGTSQLPAWPARKTRVSWAISVFQHGRNCGTGVNRN